MKVEIDKTRCFEIPKGTYVNKETGKEIIVLHDGWFFSKEPCPNCAPIKYNVLPNHECSLEFLKVFYCEDVEDTQHSIKNTTESLYGGESMNSTKT